MYYALFISLTDEEGALRWNMILMRIFFRADPETIFHIISMWF